MVLSQYLMFPHFFTKSNKIHESKCASVHSTNYNNLIIQLKRIADEKNMKNRFKMETHSKKNVGKKHQIQHEMQSLFRLHFFPSTMQVTRREEKKLDGASLVATKMKAMLGGLLVHTQLQAHQLHFISLFAMFDYRLRP